MNKNLFKFSQVFAISLLKVISVFVCSFILNTQAVTKRATDNITTAFLKKRVNYELFY
jgi:hypothetical protein